MWTNDPRLRGRSNGDIAMTIKAAQASTRLSELDFAGFAQEFLRRNPEYIAQYRQITGKAGTSIMDKAQEDMAQIWGLSFPMPPRYYSQ